MPKGKINIYSCGGVSANVAEGGGIQISTEPSGHETVTIDRDDGTTPMMIACRHEGCDKTAKSRFYRVNQSLVPTHEWYKPTERYIRKLKRGNSPLYDHCVNGGLLLREITQVHQG